MFYRVVFSDWNMHAENIKEIREKVEYFQNNKIIPKIVKIKEQSLEDYFKRLVSKVEVIRINNKKLLNEEKEHETILNIVEKEAKKL